MNRTETLLEELKRRGLRMTRVRRGTVEVLCNAGSPLSAPELVAALAENGIPVNKTTVYREIEALKRQRVVREVDFLDRKKRYEISLGADHHHHIICTECNSVRCVELERDLDALESRLERRFKFKVTHHALEFFGICERCR